LYLRQGQGVNVLLADGKGIVEMSVPEEAGTARVCVGG
jgi:hypothetical protein